MTQQINAFEDLPAGWQQRLDAKLSAMTAEERANWFAETDASFANIQRHFTEFHEAEQRREARERLREQEQELAARQAALDAERRQVAERRAAIGK